MRSKRIKSLTTCSSISTAYFGAAGAPFFATFRRCYFLLGCPGSLFSGRPVTRRSGHWARAWAENGQTHPERLKEDIARQPAPSSVEAARDDSHVKNLLAKRDAAKLGAVWHTGLYRTWHPRSSEILGIEL